MSRPAKSVSGKMAIYPAQARWKVLIARSADHESLHLVDVLFVRRSADGWCYDTIPQLAKWSRMSQRTITNRLTWLRARGIVEINYRRLARGDGGPKGQVHEWKRRVLPISEWPMNLAPTGPSFDQKSTAAGSEKSTAAAEAFLLPRGEGRTNPHEDGSRARAGALALVEVKSSSSSDLTQGEDQSSATHEPSDVIGESDLLPNLTRLFSPMPGKANRQLVRATQSLLAATGDDYADILRQEGIDSFESASLEALQRLHGALAYEVLRA
jgi:hypothetical protein